MGLREAWTMFRRSSQCQRELTKAFAEKGVDFMGLDTELHKKIILEAMASDVATTVERWRSVLKSSQDVALTRQAMNNLGKPISEWDTATQQKLGEILQQAIKK